MFIAQSQPKPHGAVRRSGTQVYRYRPSLFRSSERRMVFVVLGSINISLLRNVVHIPAWSNRTSNITKRGRETILPNRS